MLQGVLIAWVAVDTLAILANLLIIAVAPKAHVLTAKGQIPSLIINSVMLVLTIIALAEV